MNHGASCCPAAPVPVPWPQAGGLHEASRRVLSVLLREMEGFDSETKRTVVIGATNRKADLDPALLSRFDLIVTFGIPDQACRCAHGHLGMGAAEGTKRSQHCRPFDEKGPSCNKKGLCV